jgi:hypothetical protein
LSAVIVNGIFGKAELDLVSGEIVNWAKKNIIMFRVDPNWENRELVITLVNQARRVLTVGELGSRLSGNRLAETIGLTFPDKQALEVPASTTAARPRGLAFSLALGSSLLACRHDFRCHGRLRRRVTQTNDATPTQQGRHRVVRASWSPTKQALDHPIAGLAHGLLPHLWHVNDSSYVGGDQYW